MLSEMNATLFWNLAAEKVTFLLRLDNCSIARHNITGRNHKPVPYRHITSHKYMQIAYDLVDKCH